MEHDMWYGLNKFPGTFIAYIGLQLYDGSVWLFVYFSLFIFGILSRESR